MATTLDLENSPDCVGARPEPSRESLADNRDRRRARLICAPNSRPAISFTPSARNKAGLTTCSTAGVGGSDDTRAAARSRSGTPRRTPGANGALVMRPTARTDGSDSRDPSNVRWNASVAAAFGYFALGALRRAVITPPGSNPSGTCCSRTRLCSNSAAMTTSIVAKPVCATTRPCRHSSRDEPRTPLPLCVSADSRFARAPRVAGTMPKNRPHAIVMNSPKPRTVPSRRISSTRGIVAGMSVRKACIDSIATVTPQAPLTTASETLSVSSCRARRAGRAPSAARSASSLWRLVARASTRLATFAQAIRSTTPTAPRRTRSDTRTRGLNIESSSRSIRTPQFRFVDGNSSSIPAATRCISSLLLIE